jgi:hypothetical protein
VSPVELLGHAKCSFLGAHCPMENVEHRLVNQFIYPDDTVLEVIILQLVVSIILLLYCLHR